MISGCKDSDRILMNRDYDSGDWLFVNVNYAEKTLELIDNEQILKANQKGIWVTPAGDCGGTTCDGFLKLYKDGELIAEDEYLTRVALFESAEIKNAYQSGFEWTIDPKDSLDFTNKWDSLISQNVYPTRYHTQPADKDVIWAYKTKDNVKLVDFASILFRYDIVDSSKSDRFVLSIERSDLFSYSNSISLKAKKPHSNSNSYDKTVYSRIKLWDYDFDSKEKCKQAIDYLLDCFPNDCARIEKNKDQGIKVTPSIWILNDKKIYVAKTACEHVDYKWTDFMTKFVETFADSDSEIIVTECGKLTWKTKEQIKNAP